MKLVIVNTHPIQYFAPVYRMLAPMVQGRMTVVYCSRKGLDESVDEGYGERFKWAVNLLDGYDHVFLQEAKDNTDRPIEGIRCGSLPSLLAKLAPELLQVSGYSGPVAGAALHWARDARVKVLMRGDTWSGPGEMSGWVRGRMKRLWFRQRMAPRLAGYLTVGERNEAYWREMGATADKIAPVPYGVDKDRFYPLASLEERCVTRRRYGVDMAPRVLGFIGRFAAKKGITQLLDYLAARQEPGRGRTQLLLAGAGPLRPAIEKALDKMRWPAVLLGFKNQDELPDVYRACDAVLVPSLKGETWGFVVQEALACGVPVIASDTVGCTPDLIREGDNGCILPSGDWAAWAAFLDRWPERLTSWTPKGARSMADAVPGFEESARAFATALARFS
jgi:glycosyltransferase involved in cell wall biosynthesis